MGRRNKKTFRLAQSCSPPHQTRPSYRLSAWTIVGSCFDPSWNSSNDTVGVVGVQGRARNNPVRDRLSTQEIPSCASPSGNTAESSRRQEAAQVFPKNHGNSENARRRRDKRPRSNSTHAERSCPGPSFGRSCPLAGVGERGGAAGRQRERARKGSKSG